MNTSKLVAALHKIRELQAYAMTDGRGMRGDNGEELEAIISGALTQCNVPAFDEVNGTMFDLAMCLYSRGYYFGPRDPKRNTAFEGVWMVCADPMTPSATEDAGNGGFCIVGDDLDDLIRDAYSHEFD